MRRSDWEDRCKRHPEHRLSRGVCPFCLRDRLAHLSASSSATTTITTRASTSAATSPSYSSAGASPPPHQSADVSSVHAFRGAYSADSSFVNVTAFSQPLMPTTAPGNNKYNKKPTTRQAEDAAAGREPHHHQTKGKGDQVKRKKSGRKKKIGRFLSRLLGAEKRRQTGDGGDGEFFHSKTMKEKTASKWVFF